MEIKSLKGTTIDQVLTVFNESFSDYSIPFKLSHNQLSKKIESENIKLKYSIGAFDEDKIVGFILHGVDEGSDSIHLYNAGTGVIPDSRGQALTQRMYEYSFPDFKKLNVSDIILEVIADNHPAIKSYQKVGFQFVRKLNCYKGDLKESQMNPNLGIEQVTFPLIENAGLVTSVKPTWQNSFNTISRLGTTAISVGLFEQNKLIGYLIFNKSNNRILQIAIDQNHRRAHHGLSLIDYMRKNFGATTSIINVDSESEPLNAFLQGIGLELSLVQHEMHLQL